MQEVRTGNSLEALSKLLLVLMALLLIGCGTDMPESKSAAERRAEAERLRNGTPKTSLPEGWKSEGENSDGSTSTDGSASKEGSASEKESASKKAKDPDSTADHSAQGDPDGEETKLASAGDVSTKGTPANVEIDPETGMMSPLPQKNVDLDALVLGEYRLVEENAILDGDTIKVEGLDSSLRLLGLDTEETYKKEKNRKAAQWDFDDYAEKMRGNDPRPVKYGTPLGEEAKQWAIDFFAGHGTVRLEYDELGRQKGVFGRYLVYVFVKKDGEWVNYNVEAVRAGMAPYFMKYGYSRRFHDEFVEAQKEAIAAERGIWGNGEHYPDYDERLEWWIRRGNALVTYEAKYQDRDDYFQMGLDSEWDRMEDYLDQSVTVFGTLGDAKMDKSPFIATISHKRFNDFGIVAFDLEDLKALNLDAYDGEYIYVRGKLSRYRDKYQFKATDVEKVWME